MRKFMFLALGILSCSATAVRAQEPAAADLSVGYSYLREGLSNGINANGGSVALTGYANRWLGITGDFGVYHASPFGISANTYTYLVGPRFAYRKSSRVTPFAQVLLGGAHLTASAGGGSGSANGFAFSGGGGIELGISRHLAFRPQVDYIGIHSNGSTGNSVRASASIVYRFGSR